MMRFIIRYRKIILTILSMVLGAIGGIKIMYKNIETGDINSGGNVIIGDMYGNR